MHKLIEVATAATLVGVLPGCDSTPYDAIANNVAGDDALGGLSISY